MSNAWGWVIYVAFVIIAGGWVLSGRNFFEILFIGAIGFFVFIIVGENISDKLEQRRNKKAEKENV